MTAKKYKYRYRETYKGIKIDIKSDSQPELHRKIERRKRDIDRRTIDGDMQLLAFGLLYIESHKKNVVSASWYKDLCWIWRKIVDGIGNKPMSRLKPLQLQNYINSLSDFSDSYIKKQYDLITQVFRHAYINGVTDTDFTLSLVKPRGTSTTNGRSITDKERQTLLKVLEGHRGELFCKLILYCGLRPSEAQALTWKDINLRKKTIDINKSLKRDGTTGEPKTAAAYRTVPIPAHLLPVVRANRPRDPFANVFPQNLSWRLRMWRSVRREMNIAMGCRTYRNKLIEPLPLADDFTLYNLRHTYCTDLEKMGVPINIASRLMGHSSINITAKIYTHASTEALELARDLIDKNAL